MSSLKGAAMTSIQPELWVDSPRDALTFYQAAFGATVCIVWARAMTSSRSSASARQPSGWRRRRRP
jgi:uncharacterized glyoxalase superfamily protein PhnB